MAIADVAYPDQRVRQDELRAQRRCINAPALADGPLHGAVLRGDKCARCIAVHAGRHLLDPSYRAHLTALRLCRELKQIEAAGAR